MIAGLFKENFGLKIFSLLLAVLLELHLVGPDNVIETTVMLNVELKNIPQNMIVVSPKGGERGIFVKTRVRGPRNLVEQIEPLSQRFSVELPNPTPNRYRANLDEAQLRLSSRIEVLNIEPTAVEIQLEPLIRKELLVVVNKVGDPERGYKLESLKVSPEVVMARGPKSELENVDLVKTLTFDLAGMETTQKKSVPLDSVGEFTTFDQREITVEAHIEPIMTQKTFSRVRIEPGLVDGVGAAVEPSVVRLTLNGPQRILEELSAEDLAVVAPTEGLTPGAHEVVPTLKDEREKVTIVKCEPAKVRVTVASKNGN